MKQRYFPAVNECLEGFEWQVKRYLQGLDGTAREISRALSYTNLRQEEIPKVMQEWFAELWEQVAATEEIKSRRREGA